MKPVPVELSDKLMASASSAATGPGLSMSMDDLATASGVPRATLYYYFSGKNDLVSFYVGVMMKRMRDAVAEGLVHEGTPTEQVETIVRAVLRTFAAYPRMCVEMSDAVGDMVDHAQVMADMQVGIILPAVGIISDGNASGEFEAPDPQLAVVALMGALHNVATMDILTTGRFDADARADAMVPLLLRGLQPR
jgi:TetR/AcrR family transcriptional regulator